MILQVIVIKAIFFKDGLCFKIVRLVDLCFKRTKLMVQNGLNTDRLCFKSGQLLVNGTLSVPLSIKWPFGQDML